MNQLHYRLPHEDLREFISLYYLLDCPDAVDGEHERAGVAQVRFILKGNAHMDFHGGGQADCDDAFVVGPSSAATRFSMPAGFLMFGTGLLPAGWGVMTQACAAEYIDTAVPARHIFPRIDKYMPRLMACKDIDEMAAAADEVLVPLIRDANPKVLAFTRVVDNWLSADPSPDVRDLRAQFDMSDRQLARKVNHYYGHPPKYLARKYRALRAGRALVEADREESDYLRDAFYDQSHMIRELKMFTGTTPSRLRVEEGNFATLIDRRSKYDGQINPLSSRT